MYKLKFLCIAFACIGIANAERYGEVVTCSPEETTGKFFNWLIFDFGKEGFRGNKGVQFVSTASNRLYNYPREYNKKEESKKSEIDKDDPSVLYEIERLNDDDDIVSVSKHGELDVAVYPPDGNIYSEHKLLHLEKLATKPLTLEGGKKIDPRIAREERWILTYDGKAWTMLCLVNMLPVYDPDKTKGYSGKMAKITEEDKKIIEIKMHKIANRCREVKPDKTDKHAVKPTLDACAIM